MAESLRRRWFESFIRSTLARPWRVVLAFSLLALAATLLASRLEFRGSFVELLPKEAPEVQDLTRVAQKAGGDGYLVVRARGAKPETLRGFSDALAKRLETLPEVRYVEHHFDVKFFEERGLLLLPTEKLRELRQDVEARLRYEKRKANPFLVDLLDEPEKDTPPDFDAIVKKYSPDAPMREYLGSADGSELYLMVKPDGTAGDIVFAQRLVDDVKRVSDEVARDWPEVKLDYAGAFQGRIEEDQVMRKDLSRAAILSAVMAVAIILVATRRLWALAVVGVPVIFGVSLTFAVAELAIGHLNIVTGFLVAILIGLGLEYGIHLAMRYWEERREHPVPEALAAAVRGTFAGALTSALTNAAAFFVLLFAQFEAFKQFGLLAGVGVLMAVAMAYGLGPALLALAERLRPGGKAATVQAPQAPVAPVVHLPGRRWPTSVVAGLLLAVLGFAAYSVYVLPRVGFETDMRKLKGDSPSVRLDEHITGQLGMHLNPAILLVDDLKQAQVVQEVIAEVKARNGENSAFKQSASLMDLLPQDVEARQEQIAGLRQTLEKLPEEAKADPRLATVTKMLEAQPYGPEQVPAEMRRRFEATDGKGMFLLLFPSVSNHDTSELSRWASQLDEVVAGARERGVNLAVLDSNRIAARIFAMVRADGPFVLWAAALVVFVTILISLRSLKRACLVAGPLFLGMLCLAGGMYLFDIQLNFINAVVLPNLLAIAVDNSVHLYHRYEEEGPGSLGHVVRHTGLAAVVATLSNAAGYGALLISHHEGLKSIGQIALLGVMCTFLGTTVFFPAMLALLERWSGHKKERGMVRSMEIGTPGKPTTEPGERKSA